MKRIRANKQVVSLFEGLTLSSTGQRNKTKAQARGTAYTSLFLFSELTHNVATPLKSLESLLQGMGLDHYNNNFTFTNHFYTLNSIFAVNVWIACIPVQYIDWLSQGNWMDWACLSRRTGLHPTPMDNQSVTCTHFAEPNQIRTCTYLWYIYACMCGCDLPWVYDQELGTNNYSVRESFCLPILDEFVGALEHHAQHCTWLWPPSQ